MTADAPLQQRFGLTVTPQNVLGVRAVVLQEAQDLDAMLQAERELTNLPPIGSDLVSGDMSGAFNEVTQQLLGRAKEHIKSLFELGQELGDTAKQYGHTEDDVEASFQPGDSRTAASQLPPTASEILGMGVTARRRPPLTTSELLTGGSV